MTVCIQDSSQVLYHFHNPILLKQTYCGDAGGAGRDAGTGILQRDAADGEYWHVAETCSAQGIQAGA